MTNGTPESRPETGEQQGGKAWSTPNVQLAAFGRLTRDPESKVSAKGQPFTTARIACNVTPPKKGSKEETFYFDLVAFRRAGAALAKCSKGKGLHVMGTLYMSTSADADGRQYENFTLTVNDVMAADRKSVV